MNILDEFKAFALKGNAVDMAVGIILGAAFTKVVNSVVNDLIMPPLGYLIGGVNFRDLEVVLVAAREGAFLTNVVEFLIVAWVIFLVVKIMNHLIAKRSVPTV